MRVAWEHTLLPLAIRRSRADLLHGPTFVTPTLSTTPSVITIHDMTWFTHPAEHVAAKVRYYQTLIPLAVRRARKVIAITESTRRDILRILRVPASKVETVYYGVDPIFRPIEDETTLARACERLQICRPFLLFVGMLEPRKNLVRIIEAYSALCQSGCEHELVMAGPQGWGYAEAAERVQQLGLRARVRFTGPVPHEELPALFSAADAFVYPSLYEGFGLPPLEAMACGTPVISSNVSSLPEVVGDAGLLIDPLDTNALAEAMRGGALRRGAAPADPRTWVEAGRASVGTRPRGARWRCTKLLASGSTIVREAHPA